ncbi:hypothetical protein GCM10027423_61720 [Spirosoma arcticum]
MLPNKVVRKGWKAFPVSAVADGAKVNLYFPEIKSNNQSVWLRLTAALYFDEQYIIAVRLADSDVLVGTFDIRYAHSFQPFQLPIDKKFISAINKEGISLQMEKGTKNAWFFLPDPDKTDTTGLQPHLLVGTTKNAFEALEKNILSENSIAPFGWIGGCVNDALLEMSRTGNKPALATLKKQLSAYLNDDSGINFENPRNEPLQGTFNSIEDFLPFAAIVAIWPQHKAIELAISYLESRELQDGLISGGNEATTEGCYTVAYPLAAIAVDRNNRDLAEKALTQIRRRMHYLTDGVAIYQRATLDGKRGFRNWGRGVVWYLLGTVKTIRLLHQTGLVKRDETADIEAALRRSVALVTNWQDQEGFYYAYLDRKETGIDVSATAGITAAIAWGVKYGYLDRNLVPALKQTQKNLLKFITPDGFVTGITQINRGGEVLQENGFRVITQFGMGLVLQLAMALKA